MSLPDRHRVLSFRMPRRAWKTASLVVSVVLAIGAVACTAGSTDRSGEAVEGDDQELIACGFIACPRGMRCQPREDAGVRDADVDAGRTYGVCVADPCSLLRCPIANTRCVEEKDDAGNVRGRCVVSPCTMIHCLSGTQCVERAEPNGTLRAVCERDPCAFIHCIGGMHCEPRDTEAGRMGLCVR